MINEEKREELRAYLKSAGIGQPDLMAMFEISQSSVSALLTGKTAFGKKTAADWEEKLGIRAAWLLIGDGEMLKSSTNIQKGRDNLAQVVGGNGNQSNFANNYHGFSREDLIQTIEKHFGRLKKKEAQIDLVFEENRKLTEELLRQNEMARAMTQRVNDLTDKLLDKL